MTAPTSSTSHFGLTHLDESVGSLLRLIRTDLDMHVAFVSEFVDGHRVFRHVDQAPGMQVISYGESHPLEQSICQRIVDGRVASWIADVPAWQAAGLLPDLGVPVSTHIGVPVQLQDGHIYGTLCCFRLDTHGEVPCALALKRLRMSAQLVARLIDESQHGVATVAAG